MLCKKRAEIRNMNFYLNCSIYYKAAECSSACRKNWDWKHNIIDDDLIHADW